MAGKGRRKPKPATPEDALLFCLQSPLRKWLLRLYLEDEEALSPKELADYTKRPLSDVSYHVRQLVTYGALDLADTNPRRGAVQHYYRPSKLAQETPWLLAVLGLPTGGLELAERRAFRKRLKERAKENRPILERLGKDDADSGGEAA